MTSAQTACSTCCRTCRGSVWRCWAIPSRGGSGASTLKVDFYAPGDGGHRRRVPGRSRCGRVAGGRDGVVQVGTSRSRAPSRRSRPRLPGAVGRPGASTPGRPESLAVVVRRALPAEPRRHPDQAEAGARSVPLHLLAHAALHGRGCAPALAHQRLVGGAGPGQPADRTSWRIPAAASDFRSCCRSAGSGVLAVPVGRHRPLRLVRVQEHVSAGLDVGHRGRHVRRPGGAVYQLGCGRSADAALGERPARVDVSDLRSLGTVALWAVTFLIALASGLIPFVLNIELYLLAVAAADRAPHRWPSSG